MKFLDRRVIEIDVNNSFIIRGPQTIYGLAKAKKPIDHLPVPPREYSGQEPDAQVRGNKRNHDQEYRDLRLVPLVTGAQW
jgi:hypothetical protein